MIGKLLPNLFLRLSIIYFWLRQRKSIFDKDAQIKWLIRQLIS